MYPYSILLLLFISTFSFAELKLSEVLYDTPGVDSSEEWIELFNSGCETINLSHYSIADNAKRFTLSGILQAGDYFVLAKNQRGFQNLYDIAPNMSGMPLSLGNSGDYVELYKNENLIDFVAWEGKVSGWNISASHTSLYRHSASNRSNKNEWRASAFDSPGNGSLKQNCQGSGVGIGVGVGVDPKYNGNYYDSVFTLNGARLKSALQDLLEVDHIKLSYNEVWNALQSTDEDPANTNNVILLYTGRSHDKNDRDGQPGFDNQSWNREHIWPKSIGFPSRSQYGYTDIHHIRPTDKTVNGARDSKDFDDGGRPYSEAPDTYTDNDSWEPRDQVKGDIARMMFYMDVRYDGSDGNMNDLYLVNNTRSTRGDSFFGVLCTLYTWHKEDPVDSFEMRRNNRIQDWQGNRNPFIDHPEWVVEFYGERCN